MDTREQQIAALKELRNLIKKKDNLIKEEKECNRRISNSWERAAAKFNYDTLPTDYEHHRREQIYSRNRERMIQDYNNRQRTFNIIMVILFLGVFAFSVFYYHVNIFPSLKEWDTFEKAVAYGGQIIIPIIILLIGIFGSKLDVDGVNK